MLSLILALSIQAAPVQPSYVITDIDAGYNQAAYDACVDSSDEVDCE